MSSIDCVSLMQQAQGQVTEQALSVDMLAKSFWCSWPA